MSQPWLPDLFAARPLGLPFRRFELALGLACIIALTVAGTLLVNSAPAGLPRLYRLVWRLLDVPLHVLLGVVIASPFILRAPNRRQALLLLGCAILFSAAIDLDHLFAVRRLSFTRLFYLYARPDTHSLLFALVCGLVVYLVGRSFPFAWITTAALAAHVLHDAASGRTPFLWPATPDTLSEPVAYSAICIVYLLTWFLAQRPP